MEKKNALEVDSNVFIHSKCCNAHWELVYDGENYELVCEKCGQSTGLSIQIVGPHIEGCACCGTDKITERTKH